MADNSGNQGIIHGKDVKVERLAPVDPELGPHQRAPRTSMWTAPGEGYCCSSQGVHVASILLRHLVEIEMEEYIRQKIAQSLQFGGWDYDMRHADGKQLGHTPGGGIALWASDALRFAYLLLRKGLWEIFNLFLLNI
jgi:CubicO group peptidase (beta-lactamase class C family)